MNSATRFVFRLLIRNECTIWSHHRLRDLIGCLWMTFVRPEQLVSNAILVLITFAVEIKEVSSLNFSTVIINRNQLQFLENE